MGRRFGHAAVELITQGQFGNMVSVRGAKLAVVPLKEVRKSPRLVDVERLYDTERLNVKVESPILDA
jgi:6-phosphofructokinase